MEDNNNLEQNNSNSSKSELGSPEGKGSESELSLAELSARLDKQLQDTDETAKEIEQYKDVITKQQMLLEKQMAEIKELKEQNLKNALHGDNNHVETVEEIFAKNFGK